MASEAKIGLLLGLAIIFVVAFVINGLPRFGNADPSDDLTNVVNDSPPGIRPGVPAEVFRLGRTPDPDLHETPPAPEDNERFRDLLPGTTSPGEFANNLGPGTQDLTNEG